MSNLTLSWSTRREIERFAHEMQRHGHGLGNGSTIRRLIGLQPVPVDGNPALGARSGYFRVPLRDGTFGFLQRRSDDCLQAAIASAAQL